LQKLFEIVAPEIVILLVLEIFGGLSEKAVCPIGSDTRRETESGGFPPASANPTSFPDATPSRIPAIAPIALADPIFGEYSSDTRNER
jgi:hypothetical protein